MSEVNTAEANSMTEPMSDERLKELKAYRGLFPEVVTELIAEVERQRLEIIGMKEDEFIAGTHLDDDGWRDTVALSSMRQLGDELVSLGLYEMDTTRGVGRRWWYRKKGSSHDG